MRASGAAMLRREPSEQYPPLHLAAFLSTPLLLTLLDYQWWLAAVYLVSLWLCFR